MGHNTYGEPAWPNDLYTCSQFVFRYFCCIGLAVLDPAAMGGEPTNHLLLLLKFYRMVFLPSFPNFTYSSNKLLGVLAMAAVPAGLITIPFIESINKFKTLTSSIATILFLLGTLAAVWLGYCLLEN
jgi:cytochrome b6-f complex subunit 4